MKVVLEIAADAHSPMFDWAIDLCRRSGDYIEVAAPGGAPSVHRTTFRTTDQLRSFLAVLDVVRHWRKAAFFVDGVLVNRYEAAQRVHALLRQVRPVDAALDRLGHDLRQRRSEEPPTPEAPF